MTAPKNISTSFAIEEEHSVHGSNKKKKKQFSYKLFSPQLVGIKEKINEKLLISHLFFLITFRSMPDLYCILEVNEGAKVKLSETNEGKNLESQKEKDKKKNIYIKMKIIFRIKTAIKAREDTPIICKKIGFKRI